MVVTLAQLREDPELCAIIKRQQRNLLSGIGEKGSKYVVNLRDPARPTFKTGQYRLTDKGVAKCREME